MATESAFDLPALAVETFEKATFHLASVFGGWPFARFLAALNRHQAVSFQFGSDQLVEMFRVASAVPDNAPKLDTSMSFTNNGISLNRVARRSDANARADHQMRIHVDAGGQLRPTWHVKLAFSPARTEVKRGMSDFEAGAVSD